MAGGQGGDLVVVRAAPGTEGKKTMRAKAGEGFGLSPTRRVAALRCRALPFLLPNGAIEAYTWPR